MTSKRFTLGVCEKGLAIRDNVTNEQYFEKDDTVFFKLCELLNYYERTCLHYEKRMRELNDEIYKLKGETEVIVGELE